jgi:hypothetical protein
MAVIAGRDARRRHRARYGALAGVAGPFNYWRNDMGANSVVKLNAIGQQGQEFFLVVDFTNRQASVVMVDPRNGNMVVTDVQSIAQRGN